MLPTEFYLPRRKDGIVIKDLVDCSFLNFQGNADLGGTGVRIIMTVSLVVIIII